MVIAGICASVGGSVYWPWNNCKGTCPSGANDRGQYITILLFVGLGLLLLFGSVWGFLYWGVAMSMRSVPTSLGIARSETRTGLRTTSKVTSDALHLKPMRASKDAISGGMKEGFGIPFRGAARLIGGKRSKSSSSHHHRKR